MTSIVYSLGTVFISNYFLHETILMFWIHSSVLPSVSLTTPSVTSGGNEKHNYICGKDKDNKRSGIATMYK